MAFGSLWGVDRGTRAGVAPEVPRAARPQPEAKQEKTRGWRGHRRMGRRFAPVPDSRAVRRQGAGAAGQRRRGRGGPAGGAFKPSCCRLGCTALRPTVHLAASLGHQQARCGPPWLRASGCSAPSPGTAGEQRWGGRRAAPGSSLPPAGSRGTRDWVAGGFAALEPGFLQQRRQEGENEWLERTHAQALTHTHARARTHTAPRGGLSEPLTFILLSIWANLDLRACDPRPGW